MTTPQASEYQLNIDGQQTYISIISYSDRYFVTVSQLETFGTMIQASADITPEGTLAYNIRTLIGKRDEELLTLFARRLMDRIHNSNNNNNSNSKQNISPSKSLILGIGLKPDYETLETVRAIIHALDTLDHIWGSKRTIKKNNNEEENNNNNNNDSDDILSSSIPLLFPKLSTTVSGGPEDIQIPMINDSVGTAAAIAAAERAAQVFAMGPGSIVSSNTLDKELMEMAIQ